MKTDLTALDWPSLEPRHSPGAALDPRGPGASPRPRGGPALAQGGPGPGPSTPAASPPAL